MGMSIDEAHGILSNGLANAPSEHEWCVAFKVAIDTMRKYQLMQANYKNRLKADLVAMLTEIQTEIDEIPINADNSEPFKLGQASAYDKCENLIYQKINAIKAESEDKE